MFRKRKPKPVRDALAEAGISIGSFLGHHLLCELEQAGYTDGNNFEIDLYDIESQGWYDIKAVAGTIWDKFKKRENAIAHVRFDEYTRDHVVGLSEYYWTIMILMSDEVTYRTFNWLSYYDLLGNRIEDV